MDAETGSQYLKDKEGLKKQYQEGKTANIL